MNTQKLLFIFKNCQLLFYFCSAFSPSCLFFSYVEKNQNQNYRHEIARLWSSPEIIAVPEEEVDEEDEEDEEDNVKTASAFEDLK